VAINSNIIETTRCCPSQVAKKHIKCLLERQRIRKLGWEPNNTALQTLSLKEDYAGLVTCCEWSPVHSTASTTLGGSRFQEGTRLAKDKLKRHSQKGSAKNGTHPGGGKGGSSQQIRMASACGPIHLFGRGMNQGRPYQTESLITHNHIFYSHQYKKYHNNITACYEMN